MGNMREISLDECGKVSGGWDVVGRKKYFDSTGGTNVRFGELISSGIMSNPELIEYSEDGGVDEGDEEIVVNGITAKLEGELHKSADKLTNQLLLMGTLLTGGIGAEAALFENLVAVVGRELAARIAAGGALLGDMAVEKSLNDKVYNVLLNNAVKDFEDDGRINRSTEQDWKAYDQFIKEYNAYVENLSPDEPEFGDSD